MKRGKPIILFLTVFLSVAAIVFARVQVRRWYFPFSVVVTSDNAQEIIRCTKMDEEYFVFLPGYVPREEMELRTNLLYDVFIDGQQVTEKTTCADFPMNTKMELYFRALDHEDHETVTFVQSENVAAMYVDVYSGNMEFIHDKKGNKETADLRLYAADGRLDFAGSAESVKSRGNASWWETDKKSYSVNLFEPADLLGMGTAHRWILLANACDLSHIRNKVAFDVAKTAGLSFSPTANWVDLYLNGEYAGLYLLSERNEIHPERVNVPVENGFLVSMEIPERLEIQNYPYVSTQKGLALRIHHSSVTEETLEKLWQSVENAIVAEDGMDPVSGKRWDQLIDLDSWAHKYLQEELFGNYDAGSISQFFYCDLSDPQGKIYAGPIWDFDNSMGTDEWISSNPRSFLANRPHFYSTEDAPLFHGLYQKEVFLDRVVELFTTVYEPIITELVDGKLWDYADQVAQACYVNQLRWDTGDASGETERIEQFLRERLECYHDLWINQTEYCTVELTFDYSTWSCWLVKRGERLPQLPWEEKYQWYHDDTGLPVDSTQPVLENIRLHAVKK